jgi:hypothetical protein
MEGRCLKCLAYLDQGFLDLPEYNLCLIGSALGCEDRAANHDVVSAA